MVIEWTELLLPIISDLIIIIVLTIAGFGIKLFREWKVEQWIKEMVIDAVLFAQEKYWDLSGEEKFEKAKELLLAELKSRGFKISEEWLEALIDRMVMELRALFGDEDWYRPEAIAIRKKELKELADSDGTKDPDFKF